MPELNGGGTRVPPAASDGAGAADGGGGVVGFGQLCHDRPWQQRGEVGAGDDFHFRGQQQGAAGAHKRGHSEAGGWGRRKPLAPMYTPGSTGLAVWCPWFARCCWAPCRWFCWCCRPRLSVAGVGSTRGGCRRCWWGGRMRGPVWCLVEIRAVMMTPSWSALCLAPALACTGRFSCRRVAPQPRACGSVFGAGGNVGR